MSKHPFEKQDPRIKVPPVILKCQLSKMFMSLLIKRVGGPTMKVKRWNKIRYLVSQSFQSMTLLHLRVVQLELHVNVCNYFCF